MLISNNAYVGVELLARLASHDARRPCRARTLAEWIHESVTRTDTLLAPFCQAGLVMEACEPAAGYYLARPAEQITVAEIIGALDEPRLLQDRPLNAASLKPEGIGNLHGTDLLWEALKTSILLFLSGISLAEIASDSEWRFVEDDDADVEIRHHAPSMTIH